ncbi:hypothetical protein NC651_020590 [Populus alba x Populus x berolinensis]|nr:hypothetical protein NC651_020590 [Populus alba x Populus x berolinensis]
MAVLIHLKINSLSALQCILSLRVLFVMEKILIKMPHSTLTRVFLKSMLVHTNPSGVASRHDILEAYRLAVKADPVSAFGGIVAYNVEVDQALAKEIREFRSPTDGETRMFYEIVAAPKYKKKGLEILRGKSKTLRILEAKSNEKGKLSLRQDGGGG